ncbi:MAG: crotonase/enoyl-CoA hydratase family protein [Myxococcales bacterium]|nr:crotonase/enoyl-CoA hydratase family protein [Myxococcales bacterium]
MSHSERVNIERGDDGVTHVRLSRPEKRNGLDLAMFEAILDAAKTLARDDSLRAVVLSGDGPAFCAGLDFKSFMASPEVAPRLLARPTGAEGNRAQRVALQWRELSVPVIAALHGAVFGGGLQIALGADVRYAARDAQLSVMEIQYGLIPDMAITQTLLPFMPLDRLKELVYTGRVISGERAAELGLVTAVADDPLAAAFATAREIAGRSPSAVRAAKRLLERAPRLAPEQALALETSLQLTLLGTPEQLQAVATRGRGAK